MRQTAPEDVILASLNLLLLTKPLCYRRRSGLRQTAPEDVILPSMLLTKPLCCELDLYAAH
jgi:hypothetical protein